MAGPIAITNGGRYHPPPSSMIATHVINGQGQPNITRDQFADLLQESLAVDDGGQSALGEDVVVNLKLVGVVVSLGIEPLIDGPRDDPFRPQLDQGKNLSELQRCLDVIELAFRQSPEIVFRDLEPISSGQSNSSSVYAWILPILLSVVLQCSTAKIHIKCADLIGLCLNGDARCSIGECNSVAEYYKEIVSGKLNLAQCDAY